jgi:hypothetical protein
MESAVATVSESQSSCFDNTLLQMIYTAIALDTPGFSRSAQQFVGELVRDAGADDGMTAIVVLSVPDMKVRSFSMGSHFSSV